MNHPFSVLNESKQKRVFMLLLTLTVVTIIGLQITGKPLKTDVSPSGIVSFELAGSIDNAQKMIASWGEQGQLYIGLNLGLDFLFLVLYPLTIGLGGILVAKKHMLDNTNIWKIAIVLAWGQLLAGILDSFENYALIRILLGNTSEFWATLAKWCAIPKFTIVLLGLLFMLFTWMWSLTKK